MMLSGTIIVKKQQATAMRQVYFTVILKTKNLCASSRKRMIGYNINIEVDQKTCLLSCNCKLKYFCTVVSQA